MTYDKDFYSLKAKKNNLKARSYFKLQEIDERYDFIKANQRILDLGSSPGSWSQYLLQKTKGNISIIGIDVKNTLLSHQNYLFIQENLFNLSKQYFKNLKITSFDGIICDALPPTSGIKEKDSFASFEMVSKVLELAEEMLNKRCFLIAKYFWGTEAPNLKEKIIKNFKLIKLLKPKSSKKNSREIFIIGEKL